MPEPLETLEYEGYEIKIFHDDDAANPLTEFDFAPTLVLHDKAERHFGWTTDDDWSERLNEALDRLSERHPMQRCLAIIERWLRVFHGIATVLPVSAYEHSGTMVYLGTEHHWSDQSGWDSGWIGWLFATPEQLAEWEPGRVAAALTDSFCEFAAWVAGEMFGYVIEAPDGREIDSCWGYYGESVFDVPDGYAYRQCVGIIDDDRAPHADDPADPPHLASWHPCKWQTHTGVIAPMWDTDPDGPTDWSGWCGVPTDDASGLCKRHLAEMAVASEVTPS